MCKYEYLPWYYVSLHILSHIFSPLHKTFLKMWTIFSVLTSFYSLLQLIPAGLTFYTAAVKVAFVLSNPMASSLSSSILPLNNTSSSWICLLYSNPLCNTMLSVFCSFPRDSFLLSFPILPVSLGFCVEYPWVQPYPPALLHLYCHSGWYPSCSLNITENFNDF